ncbi:MAG: rod shape-determining protein RodA [Thermaerobacterales bacterium]
MFLERRYLRNLDFVLIGATVGLIGFGLVILASATQTELGTLTVLASWSDPSGLSYLHRQVLWAGMGLVMMVMILMFDYRALLRWVPILYAGNLILLFMVLYMGRTAQGAQRWIPVGPFALQPSEFAKVIMIIVLAAVLARQEKGAQEWRDLIIPALYLLPPMVLIALQPDLGTSLVFIGVFFGLLLIAGVPLGRYIALIGGALAAAVGAVVSKLYFGVNLPIQEYQIKRLIVFLNPYADRFGAGYHIIQSQFAIGSGQLTGKGLFAGQQSQLQYLPEQHTDFIFSVLGEQLGFVGAASLLLLFLIFLWRGARITAAAKEPFGALLAAGIVSYLAFHVIVNVGMTVGVMPVTGLPLPFISYGGSAMWVNCMVVGLLLNIQMRRHKILFG